MQEIRPGYAGTVPVTPNAKERIGKLRSSLWSFVKFWFQVALVGGVFLFLLAFTFPIFLGLIGGGMKLGAGVFDAVLLEPERRHDDAWRRNQTPQRHVVPVANVKTAPTSSAKANKPKR
ncbi:hypothetical protein KBC59_02345 [Patescibacteria group bacterium]|nr:hypothetical protein [Patescibacteria group bacterium]